jgi:hypothetical protein
MEANEEESCTGRIWDAGFYHVMARSHLGARFETYEPFISLILNVLVPR